MVSYHFEAKVFLMWRGDGPAPVPRAGAASQRRPVPKKNGVTPHSLSFSMKLSHPMMGIERPPTACHHTM